MILLETYYCNSLLYALGDPDSLTLLNVTPRQCLPHIHDYFTHPITDNDPGLSVIKKKIIKLEHHPAILILHWNCLAFIKIENGQM